MAENYLIHHGVKGMKWGVRKKEDEPTGNVSRKAKSDVDENKKNKPTAAKISTNSKKINSSEELAAILESKGSRFDIYDDDGYGHGYDFEASDKNRQKVHDDMLERAKKINKKNGSKYSDEDLDTIINEELYDDDDDAYSYYDSFSDKLKNEKVQETISGIDSFKARNKRNKRIATGSAIATILLAGTLGATAIGLIVADVKKKKK